MAPLLPELDEEELPLDLELDPLLLEELELAVNTLLAMNNNKIVLAIYGLEGWKWGQIDSAIY